MQHNKYNEIYTLIDNNINVLLTGEAGAGKTTIIRNIATALNLKFYSIAMTKQTTLNTLLGFISINGEYIPSQLRQAVEHGGLMLLDEIDAGDPNTLLCLNTLENGYLAFPDGVIKTHSNFRLCATANPQDQHNMYTGRSKLDAATLDRFDKVEIQRDSNLEIALTCEDTYQEVSIMRQIMKDNSITRTISMRDSIRLFKRKAIGLDIDYSRTLIGDTHLYDKYLTKIESMKPVVIKKQSECITVDELWEVINTTEKPELDSNTCTEDEFTEEYAITIAKKWIKQQGNISLPNNIHVKRMSSMPGNPYGKGIIVRTKEGQEFTFNENELIDNYN